MTYPKLICAPAIMDRQLTKRKNSVARILGLQKITILLLMFALFVSPVMAADPSTNLQGYGLKIFRVESGLYPFVQVYIRTFDHDMNPLVNLNYMNLGLMVKGQAYGPEKRQYMVQSIRQRKEAIRTVIVLDASETMAKTPYLASLRAVARYIDAKRPQDQIAIIVLDDNKMGYTVVSAFERDGGALGRRLADFSEAKGKKTRLYDGIAAAMQMAGTADADATTSSEADYVASTSIIVLSDGKDEGSAISRDDLMTRISNLKLPVPIYSLAYTKINLVHLKNLQALSTNSFGKYYHIAEAYEQMTRSMEDIQNILQNDYVFTFRSYLPVDGESHAFKLGVEYPSGSGKYRYESNNFEAIAPPAVPLIVKAQVLLNEALPQLKDGSPYMTSSFSQTAETGGATQPTPGAKSK